MKIFLTLASVVLAAGMVQANCPGDMEIVNGKCYLFGTATSKADAEKQCTDIDPDNHLWIVNDITEMENVMAHFSKKLVSPWAWTDGIKTDTIEEGHNIWSWSTSGARMSYYPDHPNQECGGNCVTQDCGTNEVGDCATMSMSGTGEHSYQACDCNTAGLQFICESPDEVDWTCPEENGFFPSGPCSDLWYNCFGGHATPEYCGDGLVFNAEAGYCDFPENVDGC